MKITEAAKKRWFDDKVLDFEIYYIDKQIGLNFLLVDYCCFEGIYKEKSRMAFTLHPGVKSFIKDIQKMPAYKIFFKYRKFLNKKEGFSLNYTKFALNL